MINIFIDGSAGTTGLRIAQRLETRNELNLIHLSEENRKNLDARVEAATKADITILCLPDEAAKELVAQLPESAKVCDTSTAHRTNSQWVYGFAELNGRREKIANANKVAIPGCHASGFLSITAPLVESGVLPKSAQIATWSLTGYTGGGKPMIADYENSNRPIAYDAPRSYGLGLKHKHLPEMQLVSGLETPPLFSPIVGDFPRGMAVYVPLFTSQLNGNASGESVCEILHNYYEGEQGIHVHHFGKMPEDGFLNANLRANSDEMEIFCFANNNQILLASVFDNLGKGSSGAAIQCMNLMLGLPERLGLE